MKLLRSDVMLRIVMLPFGQLWYHFVMIKIQMLCCKTATEHFYNEIFPDGKVKYFLRKYEILLTQYEICPLGILRYHFVMIEIQMGLLYE